ATSVMSTTSQPRRATVGALHVLKERERRRRVEQYELIRRDYHEGGLAVRAIARKYGVHRRRVREAIESAIPPERKVPERACPVLSDPVKSFIEEILMSDRTAPRKQRHTAHRIWQRVRDELGVAVAESTVRAYVSERRRELGFGQRLRPPAPRDRRSGRGRLLRGRLRFPLGAGESPGDRAALGVLGRRPACRLPLPDPVRVPGGPGEGPAVLGRGVSRGALR